MFRMYKPETIARREHERALELSACRTRFEENVATAKLQYPQFVFPDELPESNVLYLEQGKPGPKGYPPVLSVSASRIKYEDAF